MIDLIFLPPNTTSKTQPTDQGVINNIKVNIRKRVVVLCQIKAIEEKRDFCINVLDGHRFLREAWECVSVTTIAN